VEVGPRLNFTSAFSTQSVSIFNNCGIPVKRLERYRRYLLHAAPGGGVPSAAPNAPNSSLSAADETAFAALVHDRMTEWRLDNATPLTSFASGAVAAPVRTIPLLARGRDAMVEINAEMGLSMDAWDIDYYTKLFTEASRPLP
jgi:phosphoribosylformylglycinamidine synthase